MRIGLIGWATRTGIGLQNSDLWATGIIDRWLVPRHPILGIEREVCPRHEMVLQTHVSGRQDDYRAFLAGLDAVLFIEHPFLIGFDLLGECRHRKIITCCVPNLEWLPPPERHRWARDIDMMWGPTRWTVNQLALIAQRADKAGKPVRWADAITGGRWGVDTERFAFRERTVCRRFLFLNGNGGVMGRKGASVLAKAAELVDTAPILFRSQHGRDLPKLPPNVQVQVDNAPQRWGLYDDCDVLIAPSRWEGLGLQLYEAQACGMPVLTTDADPMREAGVVRKIKVDKSVPATIGPDRTVMLHEASPASLAAHMQDLLGQDISLGSRKCRAHIELHHDIRHVAADLQAAIAQQVASRRQHA